MGFYFFVAFEINSVVKVANAGADVKIAIGRCEFYRIGDFRAIGKIEFVGVAIEGIWVK